MDSRVDVCNLGGIIMPHDNRPMMNPQPRHNFDQLYRALSQMPNRRVSLVSTGGKDFDAEAKIASRATVADKRCISLSYNNRIYSCCWGNQANHMGSDGQRIGQFARPLDDWVGNL